VTAARRPLVWLGLVAVWLLLTDSVSPGQILLGGIVATIAHWVALRLAPPNSRVRHPTTIAVLIWLVIRDIVKSNIAVLGLILTGRCPRSAFIDIPLELTDENGLAILACIVTATPGSAWIEHDAACNVVTIHVLDTPDEAAWAAAFKLTYERRLLEILQ
jgi:multicomponent K+:H+ antiporter subunit E